MRAVDTKVITKISYPLKKFLLTIFLLFLGFNLGYATIYTSTGISTGWSTGTTWDQSTAPSAATDTVVIQSGHTVILDASPTLDSLAVNGTLEFPSSGPYTFTVRAVSNAGAINATWSSGANLHTFNISGNMTGNGSFDGYVPGGLFNATVISIDFNSTTTNQTYSLGGSTIEFYNFTVSNSGGQVTTTNSNSTVFGNYSVGGSADVVLGSGTITMAEGNFTINSGATFDANTSTLRFTSSSASQQISIDANTAFNNIILNKSGGSFTLSGTTDILTIDGTFTRTDGSITLLSGVTLQYNQTTGSLTYNGTSSQIVENNEWPGSNGPVNVTINNSSGVSTTAAQSIAKTLSLTSGTFSLGSADLNLLGTVAGSELANGGTVSTTGTITMGNGSSLQVPQSISGNVTLSNLTINKGYTVADSNVVTIDGSLTLSGDGDLTVTAGTLDLNGKTITGAGDNTLTVSSGATVQTGGSSLSAFDDLIATSGTLEFSGSGSQETLPTDETIGTIIVNNTSNVATATGTLVIADALTFSNTSGIINTTLSNILELESDVTITGADDLHYIDGPVTVTSLSSNFDIPVGDNSALRQVKVMVGNGNGDVTVQYENVNPTVGNNPGVKSISNNRKWTITPAAGITGFDVMLNYTSPGFTWADENGIRILRGTSGSSDWVVADDSPSINAGTDSVSTDTTKLTTTTPVNYTIGEAGGAVSWDGEGADGLWNTASNWTGDAVPTSADDVTIDVSGGVTVTIGSSVAAVAQSLTIGDAGGSGSDNTLAVNSTQASPLTITNALTVYDDGALVFNASNGDISAGSTSFSSGSSAEYQQRLIPVDTYGNLTIDGATGASGSGTLTVAGNMVKNGADFTSSNTVSVSGNYTNTAGAASYNGGLTVNGTTFTVNGGSVSGTVTLSGSSAQSIAGGGSEINFDDLTINNSSGITLNNPIAVDNVLTLTDGLITTTETNLLTIESGGTISNPSLDFINGPMASKNTSDMFFAIGKGSDYRPVKLVNVIGTPTVRFEMFNGNPSGTPGTGVNNISTIRYWKGQVITGSITCRVELHWGPDDGVDGDTNTDLVVVKSTTGSGGTYEDIGNFTHGSDWVQSNSTSIRTISADHFTFGSQTGDNSLPVELASFEALAEYGKVTLNWTTASELNNMGFNLYRAPAENNENWRQINDELIAGQGTYSAETDYSFTDKNIEVRRTYLYKLESVSMSGLRVEERVVEVAVPVPQEFALFNNYPNPFNPTTNIKFQLPEHQDVKIVIYDLTGSIVKTLVNNRSYPVGEHVVSWNATDESGGRVSSGMYIYRFQAGNYNKIGKMLLLK